MLDVQSGPVGETMKLRSGCIGVGSLSACGEDKRKCVMLFLDNMSAAVLDTPGICSIVISISKRGCKEPHTPE